MRQIKEFLGPWLATAGVYSTHIACLAVIAAVTLMLLWAATDGRLAS